MLEPSPPRNPFSTCFTRPGKLPYRFVNGATVDELAQVLESRNWSAAIVGPHGSGKSTLLHSLIQVLQAKGRNIVHFTLHAGERRLPVEPLICHEPSTQIIIDGYEQLSWWNRYRIRRECSRHGMGLLVTSHTDTTLPRLLRTAPSFHIFENLVDDLQSCAEVQVEPTEVASCYQRHQGNIREALFSLYDLYERRIRA